MSSFRPIQPSDFPYFRIPPLPANAIGWVLEAPMPVGFCAYDHVPGLPHVADLYLFVLPSNRGSGFGAKLLAKVSAAAKEAGVRELSTLVEDTRSELALYLKQHGYYEEHVEIEMVCQLPASICPTLTELTVLPTSKGAQLMQRLYDKSFRGTDWYQPYTDVTEIEDSVAGGSELHFLFEHGEPIGFVSVTVQGQLAEIEPVGIVKEKQGQGFGRKMLQALFFQLANRNVKEVRLAVWASNYSALALYEAFGFRGVNMRTFLAKQLAES